MSIANRPDRVVLCIGTATEIGKTWVGARTLEVLTGRGVSCQAWKPAQSFDPAEEGPTDAQALATTTGQTPEGVCPPHRWYEVPMAPPMAADALGLPAPTQADLMAELAWEPGIDLGWVETVGGPRSPIATDGDSVTFADAIDPDVVVLVADAELGTINAVMLSVAPFADRAVVVHLNRYDGSDDLHRRNHDWLSTRQGLEVVTDPEALASALVSR